ncbi:sugar/nucleoside kinase (ribokinase family) [Actinomadura pelletieri DSM 43383]|uniref:Sugar/nucleoside kinase (Ribokinase family) n=1 Tax=Actinomadura pelletieri DSM 43383 TaxID=1120940 RepID=A0A495QLJ0_9ACTN|nr:carbohydrate kinase family protein [Actinomadura pelletieri]RKS73419.1 sugar/nucleoside kinase (ribokinase family) [Actinomadura pelletieri DSM 43383]
MTTVRDTVPGRPPDPDLSDPCAERGVVAERLRRAHDTGSGPPPDLDVFLSGQVFMDMIFTGLPGLPPPGTELFTEGLGSAPGGIANIAVAMSRLGLRVGLAAAFGDDLFGAYLWRTLAEQEGVDLARSRRVPSWPTPVTVSLAYDSDRSMITYARPVPDIGTGDRYEEALGHAPPTARACFVDIERPVPDWAREMRAAGTTVFADLGWDTTETWSSEVLDRLRDVDVFLPNAVEAMAYTRTATPEDAARALSARVPVVVVKRGGAGAVAIDARTGEVAETGALPVEALDATGAGDVFGAGFLFGTLAGMPLAERLRFANLCAGLSVRHRSGSLGAPCWGEIAAFGESGEIPEDELKEYAFVVDHIPASAPEDAVRAEPTLRDTPRHST